ncbi:hypothetical protein AC579_3982 [Pseudocercospora musae]|uniref:C2H2-type domain-containing protein n=1 Tax=Pseudocercospora musae TaxID=113226 RepID=A0A139HW95_9PEZI|nr:hypothetical protein AC579_3982 [Pseudocercospora musae]
MVYLHIHLLATFAVLLYYPSGPICGDATALLPAAVTLQSRLILAIGLAVIIEAQVMGLGMLPSDYVSNALSYTSGGASCLERHDSRADISCVALPEIQNTADSQDESFGFEATPFYPSYGYGTYAQEGYQVQPEEAYQAQPEEGYQPMPSERDSTYYSTPSSDQHSVSLPRNSSEEPVIRRRRAPSVGVASGRVRKQRPASRRAASHQHIRDEYSDDMPAEVDMSRSFPCPLAIYGCTSTFSAKNEWKRHVQTQHLRLGYWRCDQCAQGDRADRKPNDFNRKDLFVQHVRRMHSLHKTSPSKRNSASKTRGDIPDEHYLNNEANRCYRRLRDAPDSTNCIFCDQHFHGHGSWEERMEHIGRHMENVRKDMREPTTPTSWRRDEETETWLLQARIIEPYGDRLILVDGSSGK